MSSNAPLITEIASDAVLDRAYAWLCARRRDYSHNDDVWTVRRRWPRLKPQLEAQLRAGTYRFSAVRRIQTEEGALDVWAASDALVLKAMAIVLGRHLQPHLSDRCTHLVGHGGSKAAAQRGAVAENLAANTFVLRTDVKSYYTSIAPQTTERLNRVWPVLREQGGMKPALGYMRAAGGAGPTPA